jgi:hypothetical protein
MKCYTGRHLSKVYGGQSRGGKCVQCSTQKRWEDMMLWTEFVHHRIESNGLDQQMKCKRVFCFPVRSDHLWGADNLTSNALSQEVKLPEREVDHLLTFSAAFP